jgi:hypothetical protein
MRRRAPLVALAVACLVVAGCGGGGGDQKKPAAAPDDVATDIAPPKPTTAETFGGQSLSEADTLRLTTTMTTALRSGDKKKFLSVFDPNMTDLVAQQGTWFDNVRTVPMKQRRVVLVKATDTRDSSGKGELKADMGFIHQITGADAAPLAEWYSFGFKKRGSRLLVTGVKGAAADESSGEKFSRYYRQSWDDGQMVVAQGRKSVVLGPVADASAIRGLVPRIDDAINAEVGRFARSGVTLAQDVRTRKWVFMLQSPAVADVFDYLGGEVKPLEADFLAFAAPVYRSNELTGDLEARTDGTSRIVLDRSVLTRSDTASTIRHEMVHALEHTWQASFLSAPTWAVEGTAVALSDPDSSERTYRRTAGIGYLRDHATLPTDKAFYLGDNDAVSAHYGVAYLACAYLADKRGDAGLLKVLRALDDQPADVEKALGMSEESFVKAVRAWAS